MSKEMRKFFENNKDKMFSQINTMLPGTIERYNPVENKADISLPDGTLITEIPMGTIQTGEFYIRVPFTTGDMVMVIFAQQDIDTVFYGPEATPSQRQFSIDDAIGAFGLNTFDDPLPTTDPDKLVIGQKNDEAKITLGFGEINFIGNVFVNGARIGGER